MGYPIFCEECQSVLPSSGSGYGWRLGCQAWSHEDCPIGVCFAFGGVCGACGCDCGAFGGECGAYLACDELAAVECCGACDELAGVFGTPGDAIGMALLAIGLAGLLAWEAGYPAG